MEILVNERSLNGQFSSVEDFITNGLMPFVKVLNAIDCQSNSLYKNYCFYESQVTSGYTIHNVLTGKVSRQYDEIRKFKSQLTRLLLENPYWEAMPKHSAGCVYLHDENNVCGSSLAEACERDKIIISFCHTDFQQVKISVFKDGYEIVLDNLFQQKHFPQVIYQRNLISFDKYCCQMFSGTRLDFTQIHPSEGFSVIRKEEESLFFDGFRKFSELTWQQISEDGALDYKEYHDKNYFKDVDGKIYKFRISRKYRCFGYRKDETFFVLQFDLTHKMSD